MNELIKRIFKEQLKVETKIITPIKSGVTNDNFLIDEKYVIRLKKLGDNFYDINNEFLIDKMMNEKGLTTPTLYFDKVTGNKITSFLNCQEFDDENCLDSEILESAKIIKKMHELPKKSLHKFDFFKRFETYKGKNKSSINEDYERRVLSYIKFHYFIEEKVVCHNDLVKGNILFNNNKILLIDFEYAGLNNRYFDLASFISENNINDEHKIRLFLLAYFGDENYINYKCFDYFIFFNNLLWYYWANYYYNLTKENNYKIIRENKFTNIQNDIKKYNILYKKSNDD